MNNFNSNFFTTKFIETQSFGQPNFKIMIVMHGLGDQLESYIPLVKEINITGINYLLINAPRSYPIGYSWYEMPPQEPRKSINESVKLLKELIAELLEDGFSYEDIFIMGFSQGGAMAIELTQSLDKALGGIIALSPRIYMNTDKLSKGFKNTPLFSAHGRYDEAIPFNETKASLMTIKPQLKDFSFLEYDMSHEICFEEIVEIRKWLNERI